MKECACLAVTTVPGNDHLHTQWWPRHFVSILEDIDRVTMRGHRVSLTIRTNFWNFKLPLNFQSLLHLNCTKIDWRHMSAKASQITDNFFCLFNSFRLVTAKWTSKLRFGRLWWRSTGNPHKQPFSWFLREVFPCYDVILVSQPTSPCGVVTLHVWHKSYFYLIYFSTPKHENANQLWHVLFSIWRQVLVLSRTHSRYSFLHVTPHASYVKRVNHTTNNL